MNRETEIHPEYLKGFNVGYALSEHAPEIGDQVAGFLKDDERSRGFTDGRSQYELEKAFERYPSFLTENSKEITRDDIEIDKDFSTNKSDIEPDKE